MSGIKDQERLEELRRRLYERGNGTQASQPHVLTDEEKPVATSWQRPPQPKVDIPLANKTPEPIAAPHAVSTPDIAVAEEPLTSATLPTMRKRRNGYRLKFIIIALIFFVLSVGLSSLFLLRGGNTISGENIVLSVTGPFTIGGGEAIPVQVGISNDNAVPIQSATLIVDYPPGTRSVGEDSKELFTERLPLETIKSGETLNIPLRALVFGEENDEQTIGVSIEYRVEGSNALFFKEAEPLKYKISSTPIRLSIENTTKLSSGQETDFTITVTSNSPSPLSNVVVKADYPNSFDYTKSDPSPDVGNGLWVIPSLQPEETKSIKVTGSFVGRETDEYAINFTVGVPADRDPQSLASVFATDQINFVIEQPFLDVDLKVNNERGDSVAIAAGAPFTAVIELLNTLEDTIYDGKVVVDLTGNAISKVDIDPRNGYYNSTNNIVTWDVGSFDALEQITPGDKRRVTLTITPDTSVNATPQIGIKVDVSARRVSENRVAEELHGTAETVVRMTSDADLSADVGYNNSLYSDTGPIPPEAEKPTTYTLSLFIENGTNDLSDAAVTASLPPYVTWLDQTSGTGNLTLNPTNRVLTWKPGAVAANATALVSFQIRFDPSSNMIGTTPTLLGEQRMTATDRFSGATIKDQHPALTTELSSEAGYKPGNGRVQ